MYVYETFRQRSTTNLKMFPWDLKSWPIFSLLDSKFISKIHMAAVYGALGNEALIITKDKMVYGIGSNDFGCLGIGDTQSTLCPMKVEALCEKDIKTFAYGRGPHVLALTEEGEVYSWGHNGYSELGNGTTNQSLVPARIGMNLSERFVIDIACGSHHSLALTNEGEVYAWGENNFGQVSSSVNININAPRKVNATLAGKKVVCISCGQSSSMVVTDNGEVYSWGYNGVGQLGIGNYVNQMDPCKVTMLVGIIIEKIVCGYAHTLALSNKGDLYVWGGNNWGQLGLGNKTNACSPVKLDVQEMGRILDVAAFHYNHISMVMGENNQIFMWGQCLGQSIAIPMLTSLGYFHDVFACYASPSVMHQPLIFHGEEEDISLADCFKEAFDNWDTSDLVIHVQEKSIFVHKAILMIRCQYFKTMFEKSWTEDNQSVLEHYQFSYNVYKAFLKYLYTDEIDLPTESMLELLELANVYSENQLKIRCIEMMKTEITIENVVFLYSTAVEYNAKELEDCCFKFALNHMTAVIQTANFAELSENMVKAFIIKAARAGAFKT